MVVYIYIGTSKFKRGKLSTGNQLNRVLNMMYRDRVTTGYFETTIEFLVPGQKKYLLSGILEKIKWGDQLCFDYSSFATLELANLKALLLKKNIQFYYTREPKKTPEEVRLELEKWGPLDYLQ